MKFEDYVVIDFVPIKKSYLPKLEKKLSKNFYLDKGIYYANYADENGKRIPVFDTNKGPINYKNKEYSLFHTTLENFAYKSVQQEYFVNSIEEGIKPFDNFASYLAYTPYKEDKDIAALYSKQIERYKAIASGQYQEYRLDIYKREYIKALKGAGMNDLADELKKMSLKTFRKLADNPPNPNKEQSAGTLPSVSVLYRYRAGGVAGYVDDKEEIEQFRKEFSEALSKVTFKGHSTLLFSKYRKEYQENITTKSKEELQKAEFEELFERERKNKLYSISSKGEVYIRGKSKAFMKEYVEYSKSRWRALGVKTI